MQTADFEPVLRRLEASADEAYREFSGSLCPREDSVMLGVRMPVLHGIAKELLREDWRAFLEASRGHQIYEMRMLHALVLGKAKCPTREKLSLTDRFLPYVDNWAVCDSFCSAFRPAEAERREVFDFLKNCAASDDVFRKRFGLIMMMNHYCGEPWIGEVVEIYRAFRHDAYYARMAAAWGLATLFLCDREGCLSILRDGVWDPFTHNKAIQKLCESYRVRPEDKQLVRTLRRKAPRKGTSI